MYRSSTPFPRTQDIKAASLGPPARRGSSWTGEEACHEPVLEKCKHAAGRGMMGRVLQSADGRGSKLVRGGGEQRLTRLGME